MINLSMKMGNSLPTWCTCEKISLNSYFKKNRGTEVSFF